jgi:UDP-3-O-[3-hydroxymyristoyl] glucosamine N-acyltransferase
MALLLRDLARRLGATVVGDDQIEITGCASVDQATESDITFIANAKYRKYLETTRAAAVLIDTKTPCPDNLTCVVCDDPYYAFRNTLVELVGFRDHSRPVDGESENPGVSQRAAVHPEAKVAEDCILHPFVVVDRGATVGRGSVLYPGVYVGVDASVGEACILHPNVTIYDRCRVGDRVILHSSTVVGHDGFGFATHDGVHHKIPQSGIAVIEDDVELGAGCAIERAAMGETRIGAGTKFADLISIGHGTTVGRGCLLVSLVGISGSVDVGNYVVLGGQVGVAGHLRIGDGVQVAATSAVADDVPDGARIGGVPAIDLDRAKRNALASLDLYGLARRVKKLERELERARAKSPDAG